MRPRRCRRGALRHSAAQVDLVVGRIARAHGVSGEVAVQVRTDSPELRFASGVVLDTDPVDRGPLTVTKARAHAGRLLVSFAEVSDRTSAEALRGTLLVADSAEEVVAAIRTWRASVLGAALPKARAPRGDAGLVLVRGSAGEPHHPEQSEERR